MPKVSVIVPVYNVEKYLPACIDSILRQTLRDIEVICVDDGSTDSCGSILDIYALQDYRVKVLHRNNAGYGAAMNAGIDASSGEYIGIVESDDIILPEMYETLYSHASDKKLDVIKSDAFYWMETAGYCEKIHYDRLDDYYDLVLEETDRWINFDFYMNIWTGIYRREFLLENDIRFHETPGASYQDNGFWIQTLTFCKRVMWLSQAFYRYRQDNPTASVKSQDKIMAMTKEYEYIARLMEHKQNPQGLEYCNYFRMLRNFGTFKRIADESKREFCDQIIKDYGVYKDCVSRNPHLDSWYRQICGNPEKVCEEMVTVKRRVREKLEKALGIIIYGAGRRGHIVFRGIYNEGFYDKIRCFAVSDNPEKRQIGNREILLIQEAVAAYPGALVIVAVVRGTGMYWQMLETLEGLGVTEHVDGTDIEKNFYIL